MGGLMCTGTQIKSPWSRSSGWKTSVTGESAGTPWRIVRNRCTESQAGKPDLHFPLGEIFSRKRGIVSGGTSHRTQRAQPEMHPWPPKPRSPRTGEMPPRAPAPGPRWLTWRPAAAAGKRDASCGCGGGSPERADTTGGPEAAPWGVAEYASAPATRGGRSTFGGSRSARARKRDERSQTRNPTQGTTGEGGYIKPGAPWRRRTNPIQPGWGQCDGR